MNTELKLILEDGGWYEGRQREIEYFVEEIKNHNLTLPNKLVEEFLKEFVNLEFKFKISGGENWNIRLISEDIIPYITSRHLKIWSHLANEDIVPIGTLHENTAYLFLSYSGKFYMAFEEKFYLIGNDFTNCLDNIINQKAILRIAQKK